MLLHSLRHSCPPLLLLFCFFALIAPFASGGDTSSTRPSSVLQWSVDDVQSWLGDLAEAAGAMEEWRDFADAFAEHKINGRILMKIAPEELEAMRSGSATDVSMLIAAVQALRDKEAATLTARASGSGSPPSSSSSQPPASASSSSTSASSTPKIHPSRSLGDLSMFSSVDREKIQSLEAFLTFQPEDISSMLQLVQIYLKKQDTAPRAKELIDSAEEVHQAKFGKNNAARGNPDILAANGDFFRLYGEFTKSASFYNQALQIDPLASGDGSEIRLNFARMQYQIAHELSTTANKGMEGKFALERMVNTLVEAMLLMPRPDFEPRFTTFQMEQRKKTATDAIPSPPGENGGDILIDLSNRYLVVKLSLAEAYLQLSRMYESQAKSYWKHMQESKEFHGWTMLPRKRIVLNGIEMEDDGEDDDEDEPSRSQSQGIDDSSRAVLSSQQESEFYLLQNHTSHLFAMSVAYAERIIQSIVPPPPAAVLQSQTEDVQLLSNTISEAHRSIKRIHNLWAKPIKEKHHAMIHAQSAAALAATGGSGGSIGSFIPPGFYLQTQYGFHLSNATLQILRAQFVPPTPTRGHFIQSKMLAIMMHAQCKTNAGRALIAGIREPIRDRKSNTTLVSKREEEFYLKSSSYPVLFTSRKSMRHARTNWEQRLDRIHTQCVNVTAVVTSRIGLSDAALRAFPPLPHSIRWLSSAEHLERSRFVPTLASHGLINRKLAAKLVRFYREMTTPLPSRTEREPQSWLEYESQAIKEKQQQQVRAEMSADSSTSLLLQSLPSAAGSKLKIAFVAAFHPSLPTLSSLAGYILHLPRDRFHPAVFDINLMPGASVAASALSPAEMIIQEEEDASGEGGGSSLYEQLWKQLHAEEKSWFPLAHENLSAARKAIESFSPDLIVFGGVGLDPLSLFLSFSRMAPVQTIWLANDAGNIDTTGLGTEAAAALVATATTKGQSSAAVAAVKSSIDFGIGFKNIFLRSSSNNDGAGATSALVEAQKGFTERLHLLPGLGWIPRPLPLSVADRAKTREDFECSNALLRNRWHVQFDDTAFAAALAATAEADGSAVSPADLFPDSATSSSGRQRPMFLVAADSPSAFNGGSFLSALGRILRDSPSAFLLILIDPGVSLSPLKESAGEEQFSLLYAGMKNQCKDIILDRMEEIANGTEEKKWREHRDTKMVPTSSTMKKTIKGVPAAATAAEVEEEEQEEGVDFIAELTRYVNRNAGGSDSIASLAMQSGRVRFMRKPHQIRSVRALMNVADVLLQPFPMDGLSDALAALSVNLPTVYSSFSSTPAGRQTHALYSELQLSAESSTAASSVDAYVEIAVKLGKNEAWRQAIRMEIAQKKDGIYENPQAIAQFLP